jgi:hypothetical protein
MAVDKDSSVVELIQFISEGEWRPLKTRDGINFFSAFLILRSHSIA